MADSLKKIMLPSVFTIMMLISACGGGGGGGSSDPVVSNDPTLPAAGGTGTVTLTGGTGENKFGIPKLWHRVSCVRNFVNPTRTELDDTDVYFYFGDDKFFYFWYENSKWYGASESYNFDSVTNSFTVGDEAGRTKIVIDGTSAMMFDNDFDLSTMESVSSFTKSVTITADDEDENRIDNTLVRPVINTLSATYGSGNVSIAYNITAPAGKTISVVSFQLLSPALVAKYDENENYYKDNFAVVGQAQDGGEAPDTVSGSIGSGTYSQALPGAENGDWIIYNVTVECVGGSKYFLTSQVRGEIESTYSWWDDNFDKYKETTEAIRTFKVTGSTPVITAPVITSASVSGTNLTVNVSGSPVIVVVKYVAQGHYSKEDSVVTYTEYAGLSGSTATLDLSTPPAGDYYISQIGLTDAAGNSSVYYGYDKGISFWSGDYSDFGLNLETYNRSKGGELPTATAISVLTFNVPSATK